MFDITIWHGPHQTPYEGHTRVICVRVGISYISEFKLNSVMSSGTLGWRQPFVGLTLRHEEPVNKYKHDNLDSYFWGLT